MLTESYGGLAKCFPKIRPSTAIPGIVPLLLFGLITTGLAQDRPQGGAALQGFPDLVSGLKAIPGVLGVETAQTSSGKQVIFAWFEDKAAVLRWYYSDMHRGVQDGFFPDRLPHVPLENVPDDTGPIMAIASITFADSAHFATTSLPISQIAIELYQPLPGGVFLGSRFAPAAVEVYGMMNYTPKQP